MDLKKIKIGSVYLFANILNKAIAFITIPIFSRLLTTSEYGIVSTYSSYVLILQYFMGLSSEYTVRNAYVDFAGEIPQYISSMYLMSSLCSLFFSGVIMLLNNTYLHITTGIVCACCLLQSFMTYINNVAANKYMMDKSYIKRSVIIAAPNLISAVLGMIFIIIWQNNKVLGRIMGYILAISAFGLFNIYEAWKRSTPKISLKYWKYILKISPPLVVHGLSIVALSQFDRIMLTNMRSSAETGIYSIIYSLSMVATAITSALEGVWTPWFTEKYQNKQYKDINKVSAQYLSIAAVMMAGIILVAPEVLKLMTPPEYWDGMGMIPLLVMASYFIYMYSFFVNLELYEKKTKTIALITMIAAVSNIILNYIFIPQYGAMAAAGTTLFSYILAFAAHCYHGKSINRFVFHLKLFGIPALLLIVVSICFYMMIEHSLVRWFLALLIGIIAICQTVSTLKKYKQK